MKFPAFSLLRFGFAAGATLVVVARAADTPAPEPRPATEIKLVSQFDHNGDQRLDTGERRAARAFLAQHPTGGDNSPNHTGMAPPAASGAFEAVKPGLRVQPADVPPVAGQALFSPKEVRTLFLDFEDADWEKELIEFAPTDVWVPARLTVNGVIYPDVGVHYLPDAEAPGAGYKRSMEIRVDYAHPGQTVGGSARFALFDSSRDPTFVRTMLYFHLARELVAAPATGFVRTVLNGESWGIFTGVDGLNRNLVREKFGHAQGALWIARGGSLAYTGDNVAAYRGAYDLVSAEDPAAWAALVHLAQVIRDTPPEKLEDALKPLLDVDATLDFLALDNALINEDGYDGSGQYGLYLDPAGRFHFIPLVGQNSFHLLQVGEYERESRDVMHGSGRNRGGDNAKPAKGPDGGPPVPKEKRTTPEKSATDLAMLISYSFVNKADTDFDRIVTKDEWEQFAVVWFRVMDEDFTGTLSHAQFLEKIKLFVTPPSMIDGRTRQTYGNQDPAKVIGESLFAILDQNHDDKLTPDEFKIVFARWFDEWHDPKTARLTEETIRRGLGSIFTQSVFLADSSTIVAKDPHQLPYGEEEKSGGPTLRNRGRGGLLGMFNFGRGRGGGGNGLSYVTHGEQLDPLAGYGEQTKPLLAKILANAKLRHRYLEAEGNLATNWLPWEKIGPIARQYHDLIAREVEQDTHRPSTYAHFVQFFDQDPETTASSTEPSLKEFVNSRRDFILDNAGSARGKAED